MMSFLKKLFKGWARPRAGPGIILALMLSTVVSVAIASSEDTIDWAPVQHIPFYDDEAAAPIVIADNDLVHAFNSTSVGNEVGVVYSSWRAAEGWSAPVDIVLSPLKGQARLGGVHLDAHGVFHLVFFGGDDLGANIFYTKAPAANVRQASAWTDPETIGRQAITPSLSSITGTAEGDLIVVYSGELEGQGLYSVYSQDMGESWTAPEPFFLTHSTMLWPAHLALIVEHEGHLHLAWAVANSTGNSEAVYYTNYDIVNKEWARATQLAEAIGAEADTPLLFAYDGELFAIYHNDSPTTRWMRRSSDDGQTWTEPVRLHPGYVGSNGPPTVVVDSAHQLHLFFANRTGSPEIHGMWHMRWEGGAWSAPEPVVRGPRVQGSVGGQGFDPSGPKAVLVQGRTVLLMWSTDPGAGLNGVWHTYADLGIPLVVQDPSSTATVEATELVSAMTTPPPAAQIDATRPYREFATTAAEETTGNTVNSFVVGLVPVILLVSVIFISTVSRSRR